MVAVADVLCKNRPLLKKNNINNSTFFSLAPEPVVHIRNPSACRSVLPSNI